MLFVVRQGREEALMARFRRWGLQAAVVGRVLEENLVRVLQGGTVAAEVPADALAEDTPINHHELMADPPAEIQAHWRWSEAELPAADSHGVVVEAGRLSWEEVLLRLLDDPTIASKRWVYRQYDHQVQANTVLRPGGADAAVLRLRPQVGNAAPPPLWRGVAAVVDCPNRWVALDPERGGMAAVAEAARNLSCVGAEPLAVTDNLNFPSPDTPTGYWQLAQGLPGACGGLRSPGHPGHRGQCVPLQRDPAARWPDATDSSDPGGGDGGSGPRSGSGEGDGLAGTRRLHLAAGDASAGGRRRLMPPGLGPTIGSPWRPAATCR